MHWSITGLTSTYLPKVTQGKIFVFSDSVYPEKKKTLLKVVTIR